MEARPARSSASSRRLAALRDFMEGRDWVAGRAELVSRGFRITSIRSWLKNGRLVRLFHGVYSYGRDIETREAAWRAGLLVAGPGSALTARTALEAWNAIQPQSGIPRLIEVATESDRGSEHLGLSAALRNTRVRVCRRRFEPGDIRRKGNIELVRAALALVDFAGSASERDVRFAFLELCRLRLFVEEDARFCFRRAARRRGAAKLRPLLTFWVPELSRIRSVLEGLFLLAWVERGLKMPAVNEKVFGREVDFYWADEEVVLELDGHSFHSDPVSRLRDLEKTSYLESRGLRVIRVSWREFNADPDGVVVRIALELGLT